MCAGHAWFILKLHATVVPSLAAGPMLKLAPIISARYFIIRKPNPPIPLAPAGNPAPSSVIVNVARSAELFRLTTMDFARPCLTALVIASCAIR